MRTSIAKATQINPRDPYAQYRYYLSFHDQGIATPPAASDGLVKAFATVPQDQSIRWAYINLLLRQNNLAEAIKRLTPLAADPHGGGSAASARAAIKELLEAQKNGAGISEIAEPDDDTGSEPSKPEPPKKKKK
jgi:hypothetical protein